MEHKDMKLRTYVDIEYEQDKELLVHHVGNDTNDLKTHIEKAAYFIELIEKYQPLRVLIHGPWKSLKFDMQLQGWIDKVLLPQVKKTRLRKIAFLIDDLPEPSHELVIPDSSTLGIRIFTNEEQALEWLMLQ
jgi:hypothetical protein